MSHTPMPDGPGGPRTEPSDAALKQALVQTLSRQDSGVDLDLEARIMAQWQAGPGQGLAPLGARDQTLALGLGWRPMLGVSLAAMVLGLAWWAHQADTLSDDDLSQPDVLSLISAGEL